MNLPVTSVRERCNDKLPAVTQVLISIVNLPVTSVRERCNDESPAVTQVLISIVNTGGNHSHNCPFVFKVISEL